MNVRQKKNAAPADDLGVHGIVENIVGCKWSLAVLARVRQGVLRPGALEHAIPGISTKVLNERLRKLTRYGVLERRSYAEIPPRVEYHLSGFGARLATVLDQIAELEPDYTATQRGITDTAATPAPMPAHETSGRKARSLRSSRD